MPAQARRKPALPLAFRPLAARSPIRYIQRLPRHSPRLRCALLLLQLRYTANAQDAAAMRPSVNLLRLSSRPSSLPSRLLSTHTSPPPSAPTSRRYLATTALLTAGVSAGLVLSLYLPRPQLLQLLYPLPTPTPHAADSPQAREESARLEKELQALPQVAKLRAERVAAHSMGEGATSPAGSSLEQAASTKTETIAKWTEHRPYAATPPGPHSLSGYALRGPGKFAIPPLVFASRDKKEQIFFMHLGGGLCGHEGIIHGGLLGTVLDESLGRTVSLPFDSRACPRSPFPFPRYWRACRPWTLVLRRRFGDR